MFIFPNIFSECFFPTVFFSLLIPRYGAGISHPQDGSDNTGLSADPGTQYLTQLRRDTSSKFFDFHVLSHLKVKIILQESAMSCISEEDTHTGKKNSERKTFGKRTIEKKHSKKNLRKKNIWKNKHSEKCAQKKMFSLSAIE